MPTLVIQIPARARLRSREPVAASGATGSGEFSYVLTPDGMTLGSSGRCAPALLPKADAVVAVLAETDVSWHRITLPKAPPAKLRAALVGMLEDVLLEEATTTHFAVAPGAVPGQPGWIATTHQGWLRSELAALERANVFVDRVVPAAWPDEPPSGHFSVADDEAAADGSDDPLRGVRLVWSHPDGVASLRLQGALARALVQPPAGAEVHDVRWSATPAAAAAAEQWLGKPVALVPAPQRLLLAARTPWNLRQFDLARRNRGTRALRDVWREVLSPAWRPVRWGLVALLLVQVVGMNLWAWHQSSLLAERRQAMVSLLKSTFPQITAVLDAPLQMQREVQAARTLAGKAGDADLEPMLQAVAQNWPPDQPPVDNLRFEPGKLTLGASNWSEPQVAALRDRLRPVGYQVVLSDGRLTVSRGTGSTP